ncbi:MAG: hypothetical protein IIC82_08185 [Chloroflexi bacterium]|nr:hypothetical protein [Chloroflexota bacterium]
MDILDRLFHRGNIQDARPDKALSKKRQIEAERETLISLGVLKEDKRSHRMLYKACWPEVNKHHACFGCVLHDVYICECKCHEKGK